MSEWFTEFDDSDISVIVEAIEAWETKDTASDMFDSLMRVAGISSERDVDERKRKRDADASVRKERGVLLRAKLITLRNKRRMNSIRQGAASGDTDRR